MEINQELFDKISKLAKLEFTELEKREMMHDMSRIISWVEKLEELNTDGVEPLMSMTQEINVMRPDENEASLDKTVALENAPQSENGYFKVPKVID